ncbi:MAG: tRNA pseudouridine(55) synthase TruB [Bacilli bacterium]|nr:tRNA pseudouridine(55) synthase TruB [Bacilli bacterium]
MLDGLFLIDKEAGLTSRRVDNIIGKRYGTHAVGHLGTLDPFATGLLIVAINKGTKLLTYLNDGDKTYEASLLLGKKTSTGDLEGEVTEEKEIPDISKAKLDEVLHSFLGKSRQIPPKFSAIKVNGVPMYKAALQGKEVELKPRDITIYSIEGDIENNIIHFVAKVSKGTYIRTLGEDIAEKLGTVGHLISLRRLTVGDISVDQAKKIDDLKDEDIISGKGLIDLRSVELTNEQEWKAKNGQSLSFEVKEDKVLLTKGDSLVAVYKRKSQNTFVPERGLF